MRSRIGSGQSPTGQQAVADGVEVVIDREQTLVERKRPVVKARRGNRPSYPLLFLQPVLRSQADVRSRASG